MPAGHCTVGRGNVAALRFELESTEVYWLNSNEALRRQVVELLHRVSRDTSLNIVSAVPRRSSLSFFILLGPWYFRETAHPPFRTVSWHAVFQSSVDSTCWFLSGWLLQERSGWIVVTGSTDGFVLGYCLPGFQRVHVRR